MERTSNLEFLLLAHRIVACDIVHREFDLAS